jgi:NAD(P)-dependent dehydrogenase (short-subunit alcohol dehydrogenase family)
MNQRFTNKVVAISGATSGIGLRALELFIEEGARVVAIDRELDAGIELQHRFPNAVHFAKCDVLNLAELKAAIDSADEKFGGLDILFNNAGSAGTRQTVNDFDAQGWDDTHALLVRAVAAGTSYALPHMIRRGGGAIVNTASVAGLQAGYGPLSYAVAKAAVIHYSKVAAAQLSIHGVRINSVSPGFVATRIFGTSLGLDREQAQNIANHASTNTTVPNPLNIAGQPQDIAAAVLFLASSEARYITGINLAIDGGTTVGPRHSWDASVPSPIEETLGLSPALAQTLNQALRPV